LGNNLKLGTLSPCKIACSKCTPTRSKESREGGACTGFTYNYKRNPVNSNILASFSFVHTQKARPKEFLFIKLQVPRAPTGTCDHGIQYTCGDRDLLLAGPASVSPHTSAPGHASHAPTAHRSTHGHATTTSASSTTSRPGSSFGLRVADGLVDREDQGGGLGGR